MLTSGCFQDAYLVNQRFVLLRKTFFQHELTFITETFFKLLQFSCSDIIYHFGNKTRRRINQRHLTFQTIPKHFIAEFHLTSLKKTTVSKCQLSGKKTKKKSYAKSDSLIRCIERLPLTNYQSFSHGTKKILIGLKSSRLRAHLLLLISTSLYYKIQCPSTLF